MLEELKAAGFVIIGVVILFAAMFLSDIFTSAGDKLFKREKEK